MTDKATPGSGTAASAGTAETTGGPARSEAAARLKQDLMHEARGVSTEVQHVASDIAREAQNAASTKLAAGKDYAGEHLRSVADALRTTSRQLRAEESELTPYEDRAASSLDGLSSYLATRTLSQLIGDVEGYARREPAVFLGGAFFAGMLGGRFLKSATPQREPRPASMPSRAQGASPGAYANETRPQPTREPEHATAARAASPVTSSNPSVPAGGKPQPAPKAANVSEQARATPAAKAEKNGSAPSSSDFGSRT